MDGRGAVLAFHPSFTFSLGAVQPFGWLGGAAGCPDGFGSTSTFAFGAAVATRSLTLELMTARKRSTLVPDIVLEERRTGVDRPLTRR
jgi:hypothetical protein